MEENNCIFISSVGFRKSCNIFSLKDDNKYLDDINFKNIKDNDLVYIKTDYLLGFYNNLNKLSKKIMLVCGCSDYTIPNDIIQNSFFENLINNEYIIHIYAQNCIYSHPKITNLPIGLDYHTMSKNKIYWGMIKTPIEQENELLEIIKKTKPFYKRELKIYSNCHFSVYPKFENDRKNALSKIPKNLLFLETSQLERIKSWNNQINYTFVLSPHGNGLDCHRTWEALILGCIPIVKTSKVDKLYENLPVLIVNEWSDVNNDLLINTVNTFKQINFNYKKLKLQYWLDIMKSN